jgi:hypothetical protein
MSDDTKNTNDEIAALKKELAEVKAALTPKPEFKPEPYQRYDPTANMSMPRSTLLEMAAAVPDHMLRDIVHDNRAPTGRPGVIPEQPSNVRGNVPGSGTGWAHEIPLGPPPGVAQADRLMDEQDRRDRAELARKLGK